MIMPIFVFEHGSLQDVHRSQHDAEISTEWIDVENEEYEIFDSKGYLLKQTVVEKSRKSLFGKLNYKGVELSHFDPPLHIPDRFRQLLIVNLPKLLQSSDFEPQTASLEALVNEISRFDI